MKTTVEIADPLLRDAKALARDERTTLRRLIEEGLRLAIERRRRRGEFALRDASVDGDGVQAGVDLADWDRVRDLAYEGRGS